MIIEIIQPVGSGAKLMNWGACGLRGSIVAEPRREGMLILPHDVKVDVDAISSTVLDGFKKKTYKNIEEIESIHVYINQGELVSVQLTAYDGTNFTCPIKKLVVEIDLPECLKKVTEENEKKELEGCQSG